LEKVAVPPARREKKDAKKAKKHGGPFRVGRGLKLTRLETWLFKYWTDPRLPLCALDLSNIYNAAKLSPELLVDPSDSRSDLRPGITQLAIQTILKKARLITTSIPLVKNIRRMQKGWPLFEYDVEGA
jgi:hypothetical protein